MARYVELIVSGDDRDLKAYLTGHVAATGPMRIVFADEAGFHIRHLRERIRHHGEVQHVVIEESQADRVRAALARAAPRYRFEVKEERRFERARFAFSFDTPSRDVAARLKRLLATLPAGAALEGYAPEESGDPRTAKAELYTPEHDFDFQGGGVIHGDVFAVVDARASLCAMDFVDCKEITVDGV